jgi:beta-xylosidase
MKNQLLRLLCLMALLGRLSAAADTWVSDNGNGTYSNPLFYEEFSDPDMIRVGEDYYFTGTTMHANPGLAVLHSKDLVNWEFLGYAFDRLDLGPAFRLEGGREIYGQGIWAPSFRYHNGTFYILSNVNGQGTHVFRAINPSGPWQHNKLATRLYDLSVLFDDDGKIYVVHGVREINLSELNADLTDVVPGSTRIIIRNNAGMGEGLHFYKIKGRYFIVSAIPGAHTPMVVARADKPDGPYTVMTISEGENLGFGTGWSLRGRLGEGLPINPVPPNVNPNVNLQSGLTLHQGGIVDTPGGEWWGFSMMDHNSIGRLVCLSPVTWTNDWPYYGLPGNLKRSPVIWVKPNTGHPSPPSAPYERNDDFSGPKLHPLWQWNHVPDDSKWSLTERPGFLHLHSLAATNFWWARDTLTQRAVGPESTPTVQLDASGMTSGDVAGLALLNWPYGWIGVARETNGLVVEQFNQITGDTERRTVESPQLWFRAHCNFDTEKAAFSFSTNGTDFQPLGGEFTMIFQLKTFQGIRYSLFHYNTGGMPGGWADFTHFTVDEPRPRGLTKPIPTGRSITLANLADGSLLAVSNGVLCEVASFDAVTAGVSVRFRVVDRALGRIALEPESGGGFVSVSGDGTQGGVKLKTGEPGDAETFQWEDMARGDIMLMSLATHRYLIAQPGETGPVAANHPGPRPDRKDGSCFIWKVVEK